MAMRNRTRSPGTALHRWRAIVLYSWPGTTGHGWLQGHHINPATSQGRRKVCKPRGALAISFLELQNYFWPCEIIFGLAEIVFGLARSIFALRDHLWPFETVDGLARLF